LALLASRRRWGIGSTTCPSMVRIVSMMPRDRLTRGVGVAPASPGAAASDAPTAARSGPALARHSRYSAAGVESATMPPPTPIQALVSASSNVRMATLDVRPATGLASTNAPV